MSDHGEEFEYLEGVKAHMRRLYPDADELGVDNLALGWMAAEVCLMRRLMATLAPALLAELPPPLERFAWRLDA